MCCGKSMASIVATDEFVGLLQVRELKGGGIPEQLVKRQVLSGLDVIRGGRVRGRAEHGDKLGPGHWRHIRAGAREHVGRRLGGAIPGRRHRFLPPQRRIAEPTDRGRDEGLTSPLPPNWTGGFPASSFPVSGVSARCLPLLARTRIPARRAVPAQSIALGGSPATRRRWRGFSFAHGFFQHAFIVLLACSASNGEATVRLRRGNGVPTGTAWTVLLTAADLSSEGLKRPAARVLHGFGALAKPCAQRQTQAGVAGGPNFDPDFAEEPGFIEPYPSAIRF